MKISEIGGEFALIEMLSKKLDIQDDNVIKGIGDDCAVLNLDEDHYQLITADMIVEDDHFNLEWFSPKQIGMKLIECNVSDIVSMGGSPAYGIISMSLSKDTSIEFVEELYEGIYKSSKAHGVNIIGGDTTHGHKFVFNLTLLGIVKKDLLRMRSMAKENDIICVTGRLGGSTGGLKLLSKGKKGDFSRFLKPKSRTVEEGMTIARYSNAMIDVSDGLGSEVGHICDESDTGAVIFKDKIPLDETALYAGDVLSSSPYDYALYGGEDFELVFTLEEDKIENLKKEFNDFSIVGKILDKSEGRYLLSNGKKSPLKSGYNHFL